MYITRVALRNIRGFGKEFELAIRTADGKPRMRTVIIGKNGTCKTTLLRCLALSVCWREDANALLAEPIGPMISQGKEEGHIEVELSSPSGRGKPVTITSRLRRAKGRRDFVEGTDGREALKDNVLVCGIGAGRSGVGEESVREYQIVDSVYSLFNYQQSALIPIEMTLRRLKEFKASGKSVSVYDGVMNGLKNALGLPAEANFAFGRGGGVLITAPGVGEDVPLEAWADGYRLTMNWIMDVYAWAMRADTLTTPGGVEGIVLVDEIEQHIHPSLQITLLDRLSQLMPNAQLFITTHSPLAAMGAKPEEVVSLRRSAKGITSETPLPNFASYSVTEMLEDPRLFAASAHRPETQEAINRYRELTNIPKSKRTDPESKELSDLARRMIESNGSREKLSPLLTELVKLTEKYDL